MFEPRFVDMESFEDMRIDRPSDKVMATFDRALAAGGRISSALSLQRQVQEIW